MDLPKSPHQESTTYAKIFLQSEMFQLEHSSDLPALFCHANRQDISPKKAP
jgi:hypothetical protein